MTGTIPPSYADTSLQSELEERYLAYALSTIISRSLPDVRDGLKPVHRRILFAMQALHLAPDAKFKKSARVVGDVIGKFHPHGDQAAYDAMVRMAQGFVMRYPLVEGQGNFGNIDGDSAAAMRYTEARLTAVAQALLEDLDSATVDFLPTYDGTQQEPTVLPGRFPNLLANGSSGIAVGMATAIPPHNVGEILAAALRLIDFPETPVAELVALVPAPDFPTGGVLVADPAELLAVYTKGRGSLRLRCRWQVEKLAHGTWQLVISEIPYQVQKSRLVERIAQLIIQRKCPFLEDIRDESDSQLRIVLEPKSRTLDPEKIMAFLFRLSDLEVRVTVNLNVITADTRPQVLDLKELIQAWLNHRFVVHTRRARFELGEIQARLHLLAAHLIVHLNIDEVIAIIKEHDEPAPVLMARFGLDQEQAEAILNLRLRFLRKLEEIKIRREISEKELRAAELQAMLEEPAKMWRAIRRELEATRKQFADPRRTELATAVKEVELLPQDMMAREPVTVILSRKGWVKVLKSHDVDLSKVRFKSGDALLRAVEGYTTDTISYITASGKVYSGLADTFFSVKSTGEALTVFFELDEMVVWMLAVQNDQEYFIATRLGQGFRIKGESLFSGQRTGRQVVVFNEGDGLLHIHPVRGTLLGAIGKSRRLLVCHLDDFPVMGRGKGVRIQNLAKGEVQVDVLTFDPASGFTLDTGRRQDTFTNYDRWLGKRGARGALLPHGFLGGAVFAGTGVPPRAAAAGVTGDLFETSKDEE